MTRPVRWGVLQALLVVSMVASFLGPLAQTASAAIPADFSPPNGITVIDQQGANDVTSSQTDLTQLGSNDSNPSRFELFWSWDATDDWTGTGQTGDACSLFDYDGDGGVDVAVCVQIHNTGANPVSFTRRASSSSDASDSELDRCGQPLQVSFTSADVQAGTLASVAPTGNLITDTDPFPNLNPDQNWPNDSTIRVRILKSYLLTLAGDLGNKYPDIRTRIRPSSTCASSLGRVTGATTTRSTAS